MPRKKKDSGDTQDVKQEVTRARRKIKEEVKDDVLDICHVWKEGDMLPLVAKELTGHSYLQDRMLAYSGVTSHEIKPGTVLKWRF